MATALWQKGVVAAGVMAAVLTGSSALAQNNRNTNRGNRNSQPDPNAPLVDRLLPKGKTKQWVMMVDITYPGVGINNPPLNRQGEVRPDLSLRNKLIVPADWKRVQELAEQGVQFDTAAIVFPVPAATAGHATQSGTFEYELTLNGVTKAIDPPKFTEGYQAGERLARWDIRDVNARKLNMHIEIPVTCWELGFNEEEAANVDWPKSEWAMDAKTALEPVYLVEYADDEHEIADSQHAIDELLKRWLGNRDPKQMKPIALAKELAGHVQELLDPGAGDTVVYNAPGNFAGLDMQTVTQALASKRVYSLTAPNFLAAVYRRAGLPARTVWGYDIGDKKDPKKIGISRGNAEMTAWTEFAVMDPKTNATVWVPVDIVEMRRNGNRMQRLDRPWKYFGSNEDMVYMIPISFHAHPPTGVMVRSYPAFWGWLCTPEMPTLPHTLKIQAMSQDSRAKEKNEEAEKKKKQQKKP